MVTSTLDKETESAIIRHGEKMYETLLTNEECAKAIDLGNFYRVPADNRGLNYDKYFKEGDEKRNTLTEFNSNNTRQLNLEETKETIGRGQIVSDKTINFAFYDGSEVVFEFSQDRKRCGRRIKESYPFA